MNLLRKIYRISAVAITVAAALSCTGKDPDVKTELALEIPRIALDYTSGSQFIYVNANCDWTLTFGDTWVSADQMSGSNTVKGIRMSWEANRTSDSRSCLVILAGGGQKDTLELVQLAKSLQQTLPSSLRSDPVANWMELPAMSESDGCYYVTHDMNVGSKTVRNYEFYLDPDALVSRWVAYPLNKSLIGGGSRTNEWGLDPKVPRELQSVIYSAYRGGYQRGHQLPSADRLSANVSTFYGTNMTPQRGELNENAWASLEGMVRTWANSFDTLYVVTGADINGSREYAYDNDGKSVVVPVGYFKALLGYKKNSGVGITSSTGGYTGIGFYFEHRSYPTTASAIMAQSMTIDRLESKLGYDFFVNLPGRIGDALADKVESTNDPWWSSNAK